MRTVGIARVLALVPTSLARWQSRVAIGPAQWALRHFKWHGAR
jgi:hypothetical protein